MNISDATSRCVNSLLQAHMDHSKRVYNGSIGESASVVDPIDDSVSKGTALGSAGWPVDWRGVQMVCVGPLGLFSMSACVDRVLPIAANPEMCPPPMPSPIAHNQRRDDSATAAASEWVVAAARSYSVSAGDGGAAPCEYTPGDVDAQ